MLAALFVAARYFTLTFYDLSRCARRREPHPYALRDRRLHQLCLGHNIGASVFTAEAVRYRIYSLGG